MVEAPQTQPGNEGSSAYEKAQMQTAQKDALYTSVHEAPDGSMGAGRSELGTDVDGTASRWVELPDTSRR